jgi:D-alanyl-D-alanine carboxypeptidase/D-alanyl-D-alanine-endopeptidase (penicillin-binding protein 4)
MVTVRRLAVPAALLALVFTAPTGAQTTPVGRRLARALAVPHVSAAATGAVAFDLLTGRTLYSQNPSASLAPASNEKLPLTYAALATLGPSFRMETEVLGVGRQEGAVWRGRLVLKGYGDPTLSSADLRYMAARVRATGIRRITGGVAGDETWFDSVRTAPGWKPSFYIDESPPLSALAVDRDRVHGTVSRAPGLAAAQVFREALVAGGVTVAGAATLGKGDELALPLASVRSPTLAALIQFMDRESDNYTAELLLKELGAVETGHGTTAAGAAVVTNTLAAAGVPLAGVRIVDGSGLSRLDRLTPIALLAILQQSWADPDVKASLLAALPVAGVNGTLHHRLRRAPARGNVLAKTGTTLEASALSGYVRGRYVFAVLQNGHPLSYYWARIAQDRFASVLAAQ